MGFYYRCSSPPLTLSLVVEQIRFTFVPFVMRDAQVTRHDNHSVSHNHDVTRSLHEE